MQFRRVYDNITLNQEGVLGMDRVDLTKENFKDMELKSQTTSLVCFKDNLVYKVFNPQIVELNTAKKRVEYSTDLNLYHIERPKDLLYMKDKFIGFSSYKIEGVELNKYLYNVLPSGAYYNLEILAYIFKDLEKIVTKANEEGIVMPDLGSLQNILITKKGLFYVDYSGLQVRDARTSDISTLLVNNCWSKMFDCNKYFNEDLLFTPEIDKATIIHLFFALAFRINLKNYDFKEAHVLKEVFEKKFNIMDRELMYKVWLLYQDNYANEFIADYLEELAHSYKIEADYKRGIRRLVRR